MVSVPWRISDPYSRTGAGATVKVRRSCLAVLAHHVGLRSLMHAGLRVVMRPGLRKVMRAALGILICAGLRKVMRAALRSPMRAESIENMRRGC
jgi:hypothetical protein